MTALELKPVEGKENRYELEKGAQLQKTLIGEWRIIRPVIVDKKLHWPNLLYGGKVSNIFVLLILLSLLAFGTWSYERDIGECKYLIEHPPTCEFIPDQKMIVNTSGFNLSEFVVDSRKLKEEETNELNPPVSTQDNDKSN